ncbi:MAG: hypothetical protein ACP5O6_07110 [Candidatus Baltobacteraceae bacterium]
MSEKLFRKSAVVSAFLQQYRGATANALLLALGVSPSDIATMELQGANGQSLPSGMLQGLGVASGGTTTSGGDSLLLATLLTSGTGISINGSTVSGMLNVGGQWIKVIVQVKANSSSASSLQNLQNELQFQNQMISQTNEWNSSIMGGSDQFLNIFGNGLNPKGQGGNTGMAGAALSAAGIDSSWLSAIFSVVPC